MSPADHPPEGLTPLPYAFPLTPSGPIPARETASQATAKQDAKSAAKAPAAPARPGASRAN